MSTKKSWLEAQMQIVINCFTSGNTVEQTIQCVGKNKFSFTLSSACFRKSTFIKDGKKELYNLRSDIGETENIATSLPRVTKKLSRLLSKKLRKAEAQRPSYKLSGEPCNWPDFK